MCNAMYIFHMQEGKSNIVTAYILVPHGVELLKFFGPVPSLIFRDI